MSLLTPHTLGDKIILKLKEGGKSGPQLLEQINRSNGPYTKQALYAALRQLIDEETIVRGRGIYNLSTSWIRDMQRFIQEAGYQYNVDMSGNEILLLKHKESVTYVFNNTHTLDAFWGHVQNILVAHTRQSEPVYAYDPHYWFLIARHSTESKLLKEFVKNKRQFFMLTPNNSPLDKSIRQEFDREYTQYATGLLFKRQNYYVTVIQDYVIEVVLDIKLAEKVDEIYRTNTSQRRVAFELEALLSTRAKNTIKISRNKNKAEKITNGFKKYFYIKPKNKTKE